MPLAIFDLDETLIGGDCATLWSEQMGRLGWVDSKAFMQRNHELMDAYSAGKLAMEEFMRSAWNPWRAAPRKKSYHLRRPVGSRT